MVDTIFISVFLLLLTIPPLIFKLWAWVWTMTIFSIVLGVIEGFSKIKTGKTISRHFWDWMSFKKEDGKQPNKLKAWIVLTCWQLAWWLLMVHLAWK
jgi:uncharacterized membrane protein YbhN (UPF0104 family)